MVETFHVDNGPLIQCRIGFSIAARRGRGVVQILEVGVKALDKAIVQKYVVLACVNKLVNIQIQPAYIFLHGNTSYGCGLLS